MLDHDECPATLHNRFATAGVHVTVSTAAPIVSGPYSNHGYTCPHGTTFWVEPTGEQISEWAKDGVQ